MTQLLILLVLIGGLVAALQPAHHRGWRPGVDTRGDRDRARLLAELNLLESGEQSSDSSAGADLPPEPLMSWRSAVKRRAVATAFAATRLTSSTSRPASGHSA